MICVFVFKCALLGVYAVHSVAASGVRRKMGRGHISYHVQF